ncbi:MAG: SMP-30/gluconolactonase/LRE family protein [Mesorhizobium sp.]|nr:SMP-30/gluconolactonase/LRE family protein [Mesorhizobium sp.]MCO5162247.1 SMP-30/gluconolactonase/LRE family protein [Mesorhizobium sp.]
MAKGLSTFERIWAPRQQLSEAMVKRWFETAVPFALLMLVLLVSVVLVPNFVTLGSLSSTSREFAEFGFIALAMAIVLIGGGVDLSVGSVFALSNFAALYLMFVGGYSAGACLVLVPLFGAMLGAINGFLIGFLRARALLTTMATLIIFRSIYEVLIYRYATDISVGFVESDLWDFVGAGDVFGVPSNALMLAIVVLAAHVMLSRTSLGWHIAAVGAGRLAARHAGLRVSWLVCGTYVISGALSATAGLFYAARFLNAGRDAGVGIEIDALTAVVLGGISLMGGRGTAGRAMIGALAIFLINNGLVRSGVVSGMNSLVMGLLMLVAVAIDVKLLKNLPRIASRLYLDPARLDMTPPVSIEAGATSPFALNYKLRGAYPIGFKGEDFAGQEDYVLDDREMRLFNPEDVIIDEEGRVYTGTSNGLIMRFFGHNYGDREVYARTGGQVRGLAWGPDGGLYALVTGVGLVIVDRDRTVRRLADETNRTPFRLRDDSRLTALSNLTVGTDGKVYISESSYRYDSHNWTSDAIEGRPNGRILVYDPVTGQTRTLINRLIHPSGVCVSHDGKSLLFAETWLCRISRYWLQGPKRGRIEVVADNLPVFPANISRGTEGYWVAVAGSRTPSFDLFASEKSVRYRMVRTLPKDEWLVPNLNVGGAFRMSDGGDVSQMLWDPAGRGQNYSTVTSVRQHGPYLYLAGVYNNRIGRIVIDPDGDVWKSPNFSYPREAALVPEGAM